MAAAAIVVVVELTSMFRHLPLLPMLARYLGAQVRQAKVVMQVVEKEAMRAPEEERMADLAAADMEEGNVPAEIAKYRRDRREFYSPYPDFEEDTDGVEYALYEPYRLEEKDATEIRAAAEAIWRIYEKTAPLLRVLPDETLLQMGLPASTLNLARIVTPGMHETVIGRLDMLPTEDGYKMLEFNTDTPTFITECYWMNGLLCAHHGVQDVNAGLDRELGDTFAKAVYAGLNYVQIEASEAAHIAFGAIFSCLEDKITVEYLMQLIDLPENISRSCVDIEQLRIDSNGLYDSDGKRIDVLYRLYPIEFFAEDYEPETGVRIGEMFLDLVCRRKLALINPPSAYLLQSKAIQAIIWGLYEQNSYFDAEERALIERHFLPTYLDPAFPEDKYVIKPALGREGNSIVIVDPRAGISEQSARQDFSGETQVYQKYIPMQKALLMTTEGVTEYSLLTSCFVVGGKAGAIGIRASGPITDFSARYVPLSY